MIVTDHRMKRTHWGLLAIAFVWLLIVVPASVRAAPYAAMVMDAMALG